MFKSSFKALIPSNLSDIKIVEESIDTFLDLLITHSDIAIDMFNMFDSKKPAIFEEYIKIYCRSLYDIAKKMDNTIEIKQKLSLINRLLNRTSDKKLTESILKQIDEQKLIWFCKYKQSKGLEGGIKYAYNIAYSSDMMPDELKINNTFNFKPGPELLSYTVEGELLTEVYEKFVKPLSHPVGWKLTYIRLMELYFKDYFRLKYTYKFKEFYIGNQIYETVYKDDFIDNTGNLIETNKDNEIYRYFNNNKILPKDDNYNLGIQKLIPVGFDDQLYKELNINKNEIYTINGVNITRNEMNYLIENNRVTYIDRYTVGQNNVTEIYFESGEYIISSTFPKKLILYWGESSYPKDIIYNKIKNNKDYINEHPEVIEELLSMEDPIIKKDYMKLDGHCGLVLDYTYEVETLVVDKIKFLIKYNLLDSPANKIAVGAGNIFVGSHADSSILVGDKLLKSGISSTYKTYVKNTVNLDKDFTIPLQGALDDFEMDVPSNNVYHPNYSRYKKTLWDDKELDETEIDFYKKLNLKEKDIPITIEAQKNTKIKLKNDIDVLKSDPIYLENKRKIEELLFELENEIDMDNKLSINSQIFKLQTMVTDHEAIINEKEELYNNIDDLFADEINNIKNIIEDNKTIGDFGKKQIINNAKRVLSKIILNDNNTFVYFITENLKPIINNETFKRIYDERYFNYLDELLLKNYFIEIDVKLKLNSDTIIKTLTTKINYNETYYKNIDDIEIKYNKFIKINGIEYVIIDIMNAEIYTKKNDIIESYLDETLMMQSYYQIINDENKGLEWVDPTKNHDYFISHDILNVSYCRAPVGYEEIYNNEYNLSNEEMELKIRAGVLFPINFSVTLYEDSDFTPLIITGEDPWPEFKLNEKFESRNIKKLYEKFSLIPPEAAKSINVDINIDIKKLGLLPTNSNYYDTIFKLRSEKTINYFKNNPISEGLRGYIVNFSVERLNRVFDFNGGMYKIEPQEIDNFNIKSYDRD